MALNFPDSPTDGQEYTEGGFTFVYDASRNSWLGKPGGVSSSSGTTGQIPFFSAASSLSGSNELFWDSANSRIGVGTTTPLDSLHIVGTGAGIRLENTAAGLGNAQINSFGFNSALSLSADPSDVDDGTYIQFVIDNNVTLRQDENGQLGIGFADYANVRDVGTTFNGLQLDGTDGGYIDFYGNGTRKATWFTDNTAGESITLDVINGGDIQFADNGAVATTFKYSTTRNAVIARGYGHMMANFTEAEWDAMNGTTPVALGVGWSMPAGVTWTADALTELIVARDGGCNAVIMTDGASRSNLYFADNADEDAGGIIYDHSNGEMIFRRGAVNGVVFTASEFNFRPDTGGVAMTVNDGYGNANITFNHASGLPDQAGSSCRIECGVDGTTATMRFGLANSVSAGVAVNPTDIVNMSTTNFNVNGSLTKNSGTFRIDHPLPSLNATHKLVHSFVEAPDAINIYRGSVTLVAGEATINLDTVSRMTEGTFVLLNRDIQSFTSNETGWTEVRSSLNGNILTIEARDNASTDTVSWLVIGERQDQHMYDTGWTDSNGKAIVEPLRDPIIDGD